MLYFLSFFYRIPFHPQTCEAAVQNYTISVERTEIHPGLCVRLVPSVLQSPTPHSSMFLWYKQTNKSHTLQLFLFLRSYLRVVLTSSSPSSFLRIFISLIMSTSFMIFLSRSEQNDGGPNNDRNEWDSFEF